LLGVVGRKNLYQVSFHPYQSHCRLFASLGAIDLHIVTFNEQMEGLVLPGKIWRTRVTAANVWALFDQKFVLDLALDRWKKIAAGSGLKLMR